MAFLVFKLVAIAEPKSFYLHFPAPFTRRLRKLMEKECAAAEVTQWGTVAHFSISRVPFKSLVKKGSAEAFRESKFN
jgi:hypothetical protein